MIRRAIYAISLILCTLGLLLIAAGISLRTPLSPVHKINLPGVNFRVVSGAGAQDEQALSIGSVGDDDSAMQSRVLDNIAADEFPALRYHIDNFPPTLELSFFFRRANASDVDEIVLPRPEHGVSSFDLRTVSAWHGDILEVGFEESPTPQLVAKGQGFRPFTLIEAELWSPSVRGGLSALLTYWFAPGPWSLRSVHALGRDIDTAHSASFVLVFAAWCVIASILGIFMLGWRGKTMETAACICIAIAWLCLDATWQKGLFWKLGLTRDLYAGKSWSERSHVIADAPLLDVVTRLREVLHETPETMRIVVQSDSPYEMLRLVYHLLPANVAPMSNVAPLLAQLGSDGLPAYPLANGSVVVYYRVAEDAFDPVHATLRLAGFDYPASGLLETRALRVYRIGARP